MKLEICLSIKRKKTLNDISCDYSSLINRKFKKEGDQEIDLNSNYFKIMHILSFLYILVFICYLITPIQQRITNLTSFTTFFNFIFSFSHYEKKLNNDVSIVNVTRSFLPKGRYWLDNRDDPIYPLVHGDINAFCAYNKNEPICQNKTQEKSIKVNSKIKKMPNIYFMIIESFNPFSYLINDDFIDEHSVLHPTDKRYYVTDTPYYNAKILPNLAKYAKEGIVFSGLASQGLPTLSGMHSLFTGVPPSQSIMNVVDSIDAHVDDFPSHLHEMNEYRTFYATPSDFTYDGLHHWLTRRGSIEEAKIRLHCDDASDLFDDPIQQKLMKKKPNLKKCSKEEIDNLIQSKKIKSFPKWFDYMVGFFPDENQSKLLNITEPVLKESEWISDRVMAKEIQLTWKQQKEYLKRKNIEKPILGVTINMETHIPYYGFDNRDQYEAIKTNSYPFTSGHKKSRFIRVNKYTDEHYIGGMIDFLKREDNNTIVVVLGDHGTRDVPARNSFKKHKIHLTEKTVLSNDCYDKSSGIDSLFITSGAILYLGDDEEVKKELKLDFLKGKTIKVATDHNDLVYTIMELISHFQNKPLPPTHRLGRNLIEFSEDIINTLNSNSNGTLNLIQKLNNESWQSISYISYQLEYKKGAELLRTHSDGPNGAHYYSVAAFPTCLKKSETYNTKSVDEKSKRMFKKMTDYLNVNNYLLYHNRVFNYNFRNEDCIEKGSCKLPPQMNHLIIKDKCFFTVLFGIPITVGIICYVIIYNIRRIWSDSFEENQDKMAQDQDI